MVYFRYMKAIGYSLWFMPEGDCYNSLRSMIDRFSKQHSSPNFEPHITLIGQLSVPEEEVLAKTATLASLIKPFKIRLTKIDNQNYYFRALFVEVKKVTPILEANRQARELFARKEDPEYMPHLSLMYGDFPEKLKKKIIKDIGNNLAGEFAVKSIHLFKTGGEVKNWYRIKEFPFSR